jgi:multiple sugar transport system permease protein
MSPAVICIGVLFVAPIFYSFYLAFTNLQLVGPAAQAFHFTGLTNIRRLAGDPTFIQSLWLTAIFVGGSAIFGCTVVGMILALLMQKALAPIRLGMAGIVLFAWVLPEVTVAFVWYAFSQSGGTLGILTGSKQDFLSTMPMLIICLANLWRQVAFSMLLFAAGLRNVPEEVLAAAEVEGASAVRRFFSITLPIMRPTIITNFLLVTLMNLSTFTLIYVMTQGGPNNATAITGVYMYIVGFTFDSLGYAAAISLALIAVGAAFSLLYARTLKDEVAV